MVEDSEFIVAYLTCSEIEEARRIGRHLVEKRLAACVNIFPRIFSYYWWKGELVSDEEASLIAKTHISLKEKLIEEVKKIHSYEVPAILFFSVAGGSPEFLQWIKEETGICS